jgi:hypothetical protein
VLTPSTLNMDGTSVAERPGTERGKGERNSKDGLSAFAFEFDFDLELASDNLCTLSGWTQEEAKLAYKPVWECNDRRGDADDHAGIAADGAHPPSASALASEQHEESQQSLTAVAGRFDPVAPAALGAQPTQHALSSQQCAYSSPACIDLASSFSFWAGSAPAADCAVRAMKPAGQKPRHAVNQIQCGSLDAHAE